MPPPELPPLTELASLARLRIDPEEAERLSGQLLGILNSFRSLEELDTEGVAASPYAVQMENVLREDGPLEDTEQELPRGQALVREHAPREADGGYRVPQVID